MADYIEITGTELDKAIALAYMKDNYEKAPCPPVK